MQVNTYMKRTVYTIAPDASLREAAEQLVRYKIGTLPVITSDGRLVGLLLLREIIALVMPDFVNLLADFSFLHDFGAIEERRIPEDKLSIPVKDIMDPPVWVEETCGLLRATAMINRQELMDIPVVDGQQRLVGIVSRVDIGTALLTMWGVSPKE